jgi:hypothetical protein
MKTDDDKKRLQSTKEDIEALIKIIDLKIRHARETIEAYNEIHSMTAYTQSFKLDAAIEIYSEFRNELQNISNKVYNTYR